MVRAVPWKAELIGTPEQQEALRKWLDTPSGKMDAIEWLTTEWNNEAEKEY